jgi:hypothetical protein
MLSILKKQMCHRKQVLDIFTDKMDCVDALPILDKLLSNPLCLAIFETRTRTFSDYSKPREPLDSENTIQLVSQLQQESDETVQVQIFFDFFLKLRLFPYTQKYRIDVDILALVTDAIAAVCARKIDSIRTEQDYQKITQMITILREKGCEDTTIFNQIKYQVAANIIQLDFYWDKKYVQLMDKISEQTNRPQTDLSTFTKELEHANVNLQRIGVAKIDFSSRLFDSKKRHREYQEEHEAGESILHQNV